MKRRIAVVTVGRSDYGLYRPILKRIVADRELELELHVSGAHFSDTFGNTVMEIEADGFPIAARVPMAANEDTPVDTARIMGEGTASFAAVFGKSRPDILLVLGDRFEMHAAAVSAVPFRIPIAHIHGGELTLGAMDELFRHSLTKLSQLHFAATQESANRLIQMGEEPWRVVVSGAPALDAALNEPLLSPEELFTRYGVDVSKPVLLVTFHPVTMEHERTAEYIGNLLEALSTVSGYTIVFTYPNADPGCSLIIERLHQYEREHRQTHVVKHFGTLGHMSMMARAVAMVGNSSSGIIEAASFRLPVLNIGARQAGRLRPANVIDVGSATAEIVSGLATALCSDFRASLGNLVNPYGDGRASERIVETLKTVDLATLLPKRFYDL